ncbi:hypothetical protein GCM10020219_070270 [Nonomuraea dietziae]
MLSALAEQIGDDHQDEGERQAEAEPREDLRRRRGDDDVDQLLRLVRPKTVAVSV